MRYPKGWLSENSKAKAIYWSIYGDNYQAMARFQQTFLELPMLVKRSELLKKQRTLFNKIQYEKRQMDIWNCTKRQFALSKIVWNPIGFVLESNSNRNTQTFLQLVTARRMSRARLKRPFRIKYRTTNDTSPRYTHTPNISTFRTCVRTNTSTHTHHKRWLFI